MGSRSNALTEITRLWLQSRHGCLVDESIPVPVPYALSDIDLIALRPDLKTIPLPDGLAAGPRIILETKDEHDWEPRGVEFGNSLRKDVDLMGEEIFVPRKTKGVKFTMLRQEHFEKATALFGTTDFDRVLVVHALDAAIRAELASQLSSRRIHIVIVREVVNDLLQWYDVHPRKSGLRNSLTGDMWHLLVGFCGLRPPA